MLTAILFATDVSFSLTQTASSSNMELAENGITDKVHIQSVYSCYMHNSDIFACGLFFLLRFQAHAMMNQLRITLLIRCLSLIVSISHTSSYLCGCHGNI